MAYEITQPGSDLSSSYGGYDYAAEEQRRRREQQAADVKQSPYQTPTQAETKPSAPAPAAASTQTSPAPNTNLQSFAQMQAAGQARPAPPPAPTTAPLPVPATNNPILPQSPQPAPVPGMTRAGIDPVAMAAGTGVRNPDGSSTWTNPEIPMDNPPVYMAGEKVPTDAPNGSTFVDENGKKWVKRGGTWGYDAAMNNGQTVTGYGALTFGGGQMGDVDAFLRQYGTPNNPQQFQNLARASGMTVDQLNAYINRFGPRDTLRYESQQSIADREEWQRFMEANPQTKPGTASYDFWSNFEYVPERLRNGGPAVRRRTYDEIVASGTNPYGGREKYDDPNNFRLLYGTGRDADALRAAGYVIPSAPESSAAADGAPASGAVAPSGASSQSYSPASNPGMQGGQMGGFDVGQYLAQMIGGGPGAPMASAVGFNPVAAMSSGGGGGNGVDTLTASSIEDALRNPSAFDNDTVKALYDRMGMQIDDQYAQQQTALREEMAARGLSDSSIMGGRLADLNVGQRAARTELAARLAEQRAQDFANARAQAIQMGQQQRQIGQQDRQIGQQDRQIGLSANQQGYQQNMGLLDRYTNYGQQAFENDMRRAEFDRNAQMSQDELMLRLLGLGG